MDSVADAGSAGSSNAAGRKRLLDWPFYRLLMLGAFVSEMLAVALFVGPSPGNAVFVAPFIAAPIVFCGLALSKGKPWMYLAGGITLSIFPILVTLFSPESFTTPQYGLVFDAAMLLLFGLVFGLPTGIAAFRARKSTASPLSARQALKMPPGLVAVLVGGMFLGAILAGAGAFFSASSAGATNSGSDLVPEATVNITTENTMFVPSQVPVPAGKIVEVTVVNKDNTLHTFTYTVNAGTPSERSYSHVLAPLSTTKFQVLFSTPGTVHFWCVPHKDMGMVGDLQVT